MINPELKPKEPIWDQVWIHLGPQHPINHGLWTLKVKTDGENILDAECLIGYVHRSIEKIAENRTYLQFIPITDRLCYVANMSWEYAYVHAVEELMGVQPPERAEYIRVIMLELQRIVSHLVWLSAFATDAGHLTMLMYAFRDREYFLDLLEHTCGARMMYNYVRIGGVNNDLANGFEADCRRVLDLFDTRLDEYYRILDKSDIFMMRCKGVGVLDKEEAISRGATGPPLRGSGVNCDIRKLDPYSVYDRFDYKIPVKTEGDVYARYSVRMEEMRESAKIVRQALDALPKGDYKVKPPRKAPEGEVYTRIEDPRGEAAFHIVSDGSNIPYRVKIKSPAMFNLNLGAFLSIGSKFADLPMVVASLDLCMGEVDR